MASNPHVMSTTSISRNAFAYDPMTQQVSGCGVACKSRQLKTSGTHMHTHTLMMPLCALHR